MINKEAKIKNDLYVLTTEAYTITTQDKPTEYL